MIRHIVIPLLVVAFALVGGVASAQPVSEAAKLHFTVGVTLLDEDPPKYQEAYESFHRAYEASPSPKILSNLGLCAYHLERDGEAIEAYEKYLADVPASEMEPGERGRIESDLRTLKSRSATLILTIAPVGSTIIDQRTPESGAPITNRYITVEGTVQLRVHAGKHAIEIQAPDHNPMGFDVTLAPGGEEVRSFELASLTPSEPKPDPTPSPTPGPSPDPMPDPETGDSGGGGISTPAIAMIVVTGAAGVGAIIVGALALNSKSEYESYQEGGDRQDAEDIRASGETLNIVTDVLIGTTAAAAIVTVVLLVTTSGGEDPAAAQLVVAPTLDGGGVVAVSGRF
jgi:hypothetical protein